SEGGAPMTRRLEVLAAALLLAAGAAAPACLHPPRDYKGTLAATTQEAIIFWRDGREEMVLKVNYQLKGDAGLPASLGWVVPVPTKPDAYAVADPKAFEDAFHLAVSKEPPAKGPPRNGPPRGVVQEQVSVGEYDITVLKASGEKAAPELNDWLVGAGFSVYPLENMRFYTDRGWTFLAVKVNKERAAEALRDRGGLRPLRISFASEKVVYPLKF